MRKVEVTERTVDIKRLMETPPAESDYDVLIDEPCMGYENGKLVLVYLKPPDTTETVARCRDACFHLPFPPKNWRTGGLQSCSRIFGFDPRKVTRKDYCSPTVMARESPKEHAAFLDMGKAVARMYEEYNPELYAQHCQINEENVHTDWRLPGLPFTGGIVNKNNPIRYHFDTANYSDVWSCLLCFKQDMEGGYLAVPQYNIGVALRDGWVCLFDNKKFLHGVTPFNQLTAAGRRFTVVFYSNRGMWKCLPFREEIARFKDTRTTREDNRLKGVDPNPKTK